MYCIGNKDKLVNQEKDACIHFKVIAFTNSVVEETTAVIIRGAT